VVTSENSELCERATGAPDYRGVARPGVFGDGRPASRTSFAIQIHYTVARYRSVNPEREQPSDAGVPSLATEV
jgi:hypothetical protein